MTLIKICGLTCVEDAVNVARLDVDIIGLVFAESRRRVSPEQARAITTAVKKLARHPSIAGVFVNEDPQVVNETAEYCVLDMVQLSGDESWAYCCRIDHPFIKVIHISPVMDAETIAGHISRGYRAISKLPFFCCLDSRSDDRYGGTGRTFNWDIARGLSAAFPVMIAGGLSASNIHELISKVNPLGVDVSSGVETGDRKDMAKIHAFIEAVRTADDENNLKNLSVKGGQNVT